MKSGQLMLLLPLAWVLAPLAHADPAADAQVCSTLEASAKQANAEAPLMVDDYTREDGTVFDCKKKTTETKQTILAPAEKLPADWEEQKQETLDAMYCDDPTAADAIDHGWTFALMVSLPGGSKVTLKADCE